MITAAVSFVLEKTVKHKPKPLRLRKREYFQLKLALDGF
jgi:hypothetical protein